MEILTVIEPADLMEDEKYLFALMMDESGIDQLEFLWHDRTSEDEVFRAWPFQVYWWRAKGQKIITAGSRSCGKALDVNTPILTFNRGWVTMGDIVVGDIVFNENGDRTHVVEAYDVLYNRPCYRLEFSDGSTIVADEDHEWMTFTKKARVSSVNNSLKKHTTLEIKETLKVGNENNHSVPVAEQLEYPYSELPIDPYLFGYWLGDGNSNCGVITCDTKDSEDLIENISHTEYIIEAKGTKHFLRYKPNMFRYVEPEVAPDTKSIYSDDIVREVRLSLYNGLSLDEAVEAYNIPKGTIHNWVMGRTRIAAGGYIRSTTSDFFKSKLIDLGVYNNKRIPELYFKSSKKQRLELLRGILDSDGHFASTGAVDLTLKSYELISDIRKLIVGLGQKPTQIRSKRATISGRDCGEVYRISFTPIDINPFKLERKSSLVPHRDRKSTPRVSQRRIVDVVKVDSRPVRCIEVDSPSHMFLAGESLIPTHNSLSVAARSFAMPFVAPGDEMIITAPDGDRLNMLLEKVEDIFISNFFLDAMVRKIKHRPFHCVDKDTLVLTSEGHKPIKDICVGDLVLTHRNRWRKVTNVWNNGKRSVVRSTGTGHYGLVSTPDHKFYTGKIKQRTVCDNGVRRSVWHQQPPTWEPIGDFRLTEPNWRWGSPSDFTAADVCQMPDGILKIKGGVLNIYSEEFMWLLGHYMAEGCFWGHNLIVLSVHKDEVDEIIGRYAGIGLNARLRKYIRPNNDGRSIEVTSKSLKTFISQHIPGKSTDKSIPMWIFNLDDNLKRAFLDGYIYGDGYITVDGHARISTASKKLAFDTRLLANTLNIANGVSYTYQDGHHLNDGHYIRGGDIYQVYLNFSEPGSMKHSRTKFIDGHAWSTVRSVEDFGEADVYDIEVEEDHSYVAEGIVVHNCSFKNGARIVGRIPRLDGTGVQGVHPLFLMHDEASTYPARGWKELVETVKMQNPRAKWLSFGVTMGPGNIFDDIISGNIAEGANWKVIRTPAMYRPNWSEAERQEKIAEYGGYEDIDYQRNVLGDASGADSFLVNLHKLMGCVDQDKLGEYMNNTYYNLRITDADIREFGKDEIVHFFDPPEEHDYFYKDNIWIGMDYGETSSPSCIMVFREANVLNDGSIEKKKRLQLVSRIMLSKVPPELQNDLALHIIKYYRPAAFSFDYHGIGSVMYSWIQSEIRKDPEASWILDRIKGFSFSEKIIVEFDDKININTYVKDDWKRAAIYKLTKEAAMDYLRAVINTDGIWLPYDVEVLGDIKSVPRRELEQYDEYMKPRRKRGQHILDGIYYALLAYYQDAIDDLIEEYSQVWQAPSMIIG